MLFRTLLRAASAWLVWRWLEPRWKSTLALILGWWLVTVLHAEYVEYVQITEQSELLWLSYLVKWTLVLGGIAAYVWFSLLTTTPPAKQPTEGPAAPDPSEKLTPTGGDDGFDFLRNKQHLESRGDMIVERGGEPPTKDC